MPIDTRTSRLVKKTVVEKSRWTVSLGPSVWITQEQRVNRQPCRSRRPIIVFLLIPWTSFVHTVQRFLCEQYHTDLLHIQIFLYTIDTYFTFRELLHKIPWAVGTLCISAAVDPLYK